MPSKFIIASPSFQKTPLNLFYKIEFLDLTPGTVRARSCQ